MSILPEESEVCNSNSEENLSNSCGQQLITPSHPRSLVENIFKAAPRVKLIPIEPGGKRPKKGFNWRKAELSADDAVAWLTEGNRVGIVPASVGIGVLDLDHGGQPMLDAVEAHYATPPLSFLPSLSAAEGEVRGHVLYPTSTPTGNGKWAGGDYRVEKGYVVIYDLPSWHDAIGKVAYQALPEVDLRSVKNVKPIAANPTTTSATQQGSGIGSQHDLDVVPSEPIEGLRGVTLGLALAEGARATSDEDARRRAERLVGWFVKCREVQAAAGWLAGAKEGTPSEIKSHARKLESDLLARWEKKKATDDDNLARTSVVATAAIDQAQPAQVPSEGGASGPVVFENKKPVPPEMREIFERVFNCDIRFNVRTFDDEYRKRGTDEWKVITDRIMRNWVKNVGLRCLRFDRLDDKKKKIYKPDHRSEEGFVKDFNIWFSEPDDEVDPFIDWLESNCSEWNGTPMLDNWMTEAGMIIGNENFEYVRWVSQFVFLGAIQRAYEPGCELQQMPLLWGPRGTGKSSVPEYAIPPEMRAKWFSGDFRLLDDSKKMIEITEGAVIMEWSELRGMRRLEAEEVKAYLSGQNEKARKAYAKRAEVVPRRSILIGTTNDPTLKPDPALQRRIVVLHVEEGSHVGKIRAYLDANRNQLFAEALVRYRAGVRAHLDYELEEGLDLNNAGAVHRNWEVIGSIEELLPVLGTEFKKMLVCERLGVTKVGMSDREKNGAAAQWWRDKSSGVQYKKALEQLGYVEDRRAKKYVLENSDMMTAILGYLPEACGCREGGVRVPGPISAGRRVVRVATIREANFGNGSEEDSEEDSQNSYVTCNSPAPPDNLHIQHETPVRHPHAPAQEWSERQSAALDSISPKRDVPADDLEDEPTIPD